MFSKIFLATATLMFSSSLALANPEAEGNLSKKPKSESVMLVKTDKSGNQTFYKVSKKVSPVDLPKVIEEFQKTGKSSASIVKVDSKKVSSKNPRNPEADGDMTKQSWYYWHSGYRYGYNPGASYYYNYWPRTYYYNTWTPSYRWCYGYSGYTWGIYW